MPAPSTRHGALLLVDLIAAPPVNLTPPTITPAGPYSTGQVITCIPGTWSNSPVLTRRWEHDLGSGFVATGDTGATKTLLLTEEGHQVRCVVIATNTGGQVEHATTSITPQVTPPLSSTNVEVRLSGGPTNVVAANSHGGPESVQIVGDGLFDAVTFAAARDGRIDYRLLYVHNFSPVFSASLAAFITLQEQALGHGIAIGVPTEAIDEDVAATATRFTAPIGVNFLTPTDSGSGLDLGILDPDEKVGLWVQRTILEGATIGASNPGIVSVLVTEQ